jgi:hypothetical protein
LAEWDNKEHNCLKIYHEFDCEYLLIILEEFDTDYKFFERMRLLSWKTLECDKIVMNNVNETNRYSFGKVHLKINCIDYLPSLGNIFVKVIFHPYFIESKKAKMQ